MSDDIIKQLREAIAAGPVPGPWMHLFGDRLIYTKLGDGCKGEAVARVDWISGPSYLATLSFIAAASPDNIAALIDRLDAAERENERLRAVVSALAFQVNRDPFVSVGHWCEHGPCAAIIRDISNPNADHHGPDWTERDSEYLK